MLQEVVRFLRKKSLPEEVFKRWQHLHQSEPGQKHLNPRVIHYRRQLRILKKIRDYDDQKDLGIRDLIRLRIDHLLPRLDEPEHKIFTMDSHGQAKQMIVPKLYYLDLFVGSETLESPQIHYDQFRLALSKNGVERVERIFVDEQLQTVL